MTGSTKRKSPATTRRRVGRPRAKAAAGEESTEEAILEAARRLFGRQGFSATSTRQIADAAGIRQPTLFHYFKSKKTILETIIDLAMAPELAFLAREAERRLPADVALYRYARFVFENLATNPNVIGSPLQFPEASEGEFADFWQSYEFIYNTCRTHIRQGISEGLFDPVDVESATEQLFALIEAPLSRPRRSSRWARKAAEQAATLVLKGLLKDPARLRKVQKAARSL